MLHISTYWYHAHPNSSAVCECKGLGCMSNNFNIKAFWLIPVTQQHKHVYQYIVQEPCGPLFTRKQRFAHVRWPNGAKYCSDFVSDLLLFYQAFGINLPFSWCAMFVVG